MKDLSPKIIQHPSKIKITLLPWQPRPGASSREEKGTCNPTAPGDKQRDTASWKAEITITHMPPLPIQNFRAPRGADVEAEAGGWREKESFRRSQPHPVEGVLFAGHILSYLGSFQTLQPLSPSSFFHRSLF